ncbi:unnamed protein product [Phytomonas sp. EM1]|nr:unnamed protein product [Phytomonas sp. EM1]|eukprot:CCW65760.1 unnamed protein product [Phytomonas sp. isolate EM1]
MRALGATAGENEHGATADPSPFSPTARTTVGSKPPSVRKARHGGETFPPHKSNSPVVSTTSYTAASSNESNSPSTGGVHAQALGFLSRMQKEVAAIHALLQQHASVGMATAFAPTRPAGFNWPEYSYK